MSERNIAIDLKVTKAKSLLAEVPVLLKHEFYSTAVNRLYYACFHITKALLLTKDSIPKTHSGVVNQLHHHFVKPGHFDAIQAAFFSSIMQKRIEDDYEDDLFANPEVVDEFVKAGAAYINYVESMVSSAKT